MVTTVRIDRDAYRILEETKKEMKLQGIEGVSFSATIRYLKANQLLAAGVNL